MTITLYGTTTANSTLTSAYNLSTTAPGSETSKTTTITGTNTWAEIDSQGGTFASVTAIGSPSGHGWTYQPGAGTFANANWGFTITLSSVSAAVNVEVRFYKYSGGSYTSIGTITKTSGFSTSKTTYTFTNTSMPSTTFGASDLLYVDCWWFDNASSAQGDNPVVYTGTTADFIVTTSNFTPASTQVDKDVAIRGRISAQVDKDVAIRGRIQQLVKKDIAIRGNVGLVAKKDIAIRGRIQAQVDKDIAIRGRIQQLVTKDVALRGRTANTVDKDIAIRARISTSVDKDVRVRGRISAQVTKDIAIRGRIRIVTSKDIALRGNITGPPLTSGGFTLFANGTGTASFDHFRVTEYPDPSLSLSPILPRIGATSVLWNALTPANTTLGTDISYDGVNWTDVTSGNGGSLPSIYSQPDPTSDAFGTNTSANYTSTFRTGGGVGTWTYDTANNRIVATGGTNALYLYNAISRADIDFFADLDRADAGGIVWRYNDQSNFYYLLIGDSLASSGTQNTITLYKVASNVQTQLGTATISYTIGTPADQYTVLFTRGTYRRFRVTMLTGAITVYVDGISMITYTDGSPLSAGKVGLFNNGGATGSRYYQLWIQPQGDYVSGTPQGDIVTSKFVYTRQRLATTDPTETPQVEDITTLATNPQISMGTTIPSVTYSSTFISKNYDDLAKQSNFSWYIDASKTLIFRSYQAVPSPWILQSAPAGLVNNVDLEVNSNLELDVGNDLYRNRQTILGAQDVTSTQTAFFVGDGSTRTFTLGYPLAAAPTIVVDGITQTSIALKGNTGFAWYYALDDPVLQQDVSQPVLQVTDQLVVTYTGLVDVVVTVDDTAEQTARALVEGGTGIVEDVEDHTSDSPRMTKAAALTLAQQLINRYAVAGRTLIFDTSRNGLAIGQVLSIFLPEQGISDGQFFITQIEITLRKGIGDTQVWWYKVTASELPKQASWAKLLASGLGLQSNWTTA